MRENAAAKGRRLLAEGRLCIDAVLGDAIAAHCRGDSGEVYDCGYQVGAWYCSCPALSRCSHMTALQLVTVAPPLRRRAEASDPSGGVDMQFERTESAVRDPSPGRTEGLDLCTGVGNSDDQLADHGWRDGDDNVPPGVGVEWETGWRLSRGEGDGPNVPVGSLGEKGAGCDVQLLLEHDRDSDESLGRYRVLLVGTRAHPHSPGRPVSTCASRPTPGGASRPLSATSGDSRSSLSRTVFRLDFPDARISDGASP